MIDEIGNIILSNWKSFEPTFGRRPSKFSFVIQSGLFHKMQGVLFFIFKDGDKKPFCVYKFANDPSTNELFRHEYESMMYYSQVLSPVVRKSIPITYGSVVINRRFGFCMEWIDFRRKNINILLGPKSSKYRLRPIIDWLMRFQSETCSEYLMVDDEFIHKNVSLECLRYRDAYPNRGAVEKEMLKKVERAAISLNGVRLPIVSAHGDFSDRNISVQENQVKVIDWKYHSKKGMFYEDPLMLVLTSNIGKRSKSKDISSFPNESRRLIQEFFDIWDVPLSHVRQIMSIFLLRMAVREFNFYGRGYSSDSMWRTQMLEIYRNGQFEP
jgi:hypothetical protein